MKTKNLKQIVVIKATPNEIYEAIMDSKKHSAFTGDTAVISRKVGGRFTAFGDYINGVNLELVPDKKIVQSWHASDWDDDEYYSKITFKLARIKTGTKLNFIHEGIPSKEYNEIKQGWIDYYWKPLKKMLEKSKI
ncbi:MAG: SRPBCC domain-containing protein [Elusimicrobia bacterium]|nr:SRPBCC domain-containing protein [Elusimicrobiota bacterium]